MWRAEEVQKEWLFLVQMHARSGSEMCNKNRTLPLRFLICIYMRQSCLPLTLRSWCFLAIMHVNKCLSRHGLIDCIVFSWTILLLTLLPRFKRLNLLLFMSCKLCCFGRRHVESSFKMCTGNSLFRCHV